MATKDSKAIIINDPGEVEEEKSETLNSNPSPPISYHTEDYENDDDGLLENLSKIPISERLDVLLRILSENDSLLENLSDIPISERLEVLLRIISEEEAPRLPKVSIGFEQLRLRRWKERETFKQHLEQGIDPTIREHDAVLDWRISCFDSGRRFASFVEEHYFPLAERSVLDVAGAWGGHAYAFAESGASVVSSDLNDHHYSHFLDFCRKGSLKATALVSDCQQIPFADQSFDVIIALELIEHINSVKHFAAEIARVLRPGGICLVSTPSRWRSVLGGEPHYQLKGITLLPFILQRPIAEHIFGKKYPYPITRQYSLARNVIKPFREAGLEGEAVLWGRLGTLLGHNSFFYRIAREFLWNFVVVSKAKI